MSWFDSTFKGGWKINKELDPLTTAFMERVMKQDAHNVAAIDNRISKWFGGDGSTVLGDESRKVENDPARGIGRAAATAGLVFAAPYAWSAMGGGGGAGGAGGGTAGGASGATNPALIDSAMGGYGYHGYSSASPGFTPLGPTGAAPAGQQMRMPQQQQQQQGSSDDTAQRRWMLMMAEMLRRQNEEAQRSRENNQMLTRSQ